MAKKTKEKGIIMKVNDLGGQILQFFKLVWYKANYWEGVKRIKNIKKL